MTTKTIWRLQRLELPAAVVSLLVIGGCSGQPTEAAQIKARSQPATLQAQPSVTRLRAQWLPNSTSRGNALITAEVAADEPAEGQFTVFPDDNDPSRAVVLNDRGIDGDVRAGDHIFSAIDNFDFSELLRQNDRIDEIERSGQHAIVPVFKDRELVRQDPAQRIDPASVIPGATLDITPVGIASDGTSQGITSGLVINPSRSLIITHPSVVNDPTRTFNRCTGVGTPMGVWTFGHVMEQMANPGLTGISPSAFVSRWLAHWQANQVINTFTAVNRKTTIENLIINPWQAASGVGRPLDLRLAPFRLVAIVNRVDLRGNLTYGGGSSGETRLVFAVEDGNCNVRSPPFLVIFEYGNLATTCPAVKAWGQQWANLSALPFPSAIYNTALANLTETVVQSNANPAKPNRSAINQVRTNEFALSAPLGLPWEMREFRLLPPTAVAAWLLEDTVKRTPHLPLNGTPLFANCVITNTPGIINGTIDPLSCLGNPFRAATAPVPSPANVCWNGAGIPPPNRFNYSLNTCNGCHGVETGTIFTHINQFGGLSGFLTGIGPLADCAGVGTHSFNDLLRRTVDLDVLIRSSCLRAIAVPALSAAH